LFLPAAIWTVQMMIFIPNPKYSTTQLSERKGRGPPVQYSEGKATP